MPIFGKDKSKKPEAALKDFSLVSTSNAENSDAPEVSTMHEENTNGNSEKAFGKWGPNRKKVLLDAILNLPEDEKQAIFEYCNYFSSDFEKFQKENAALLKDEAQGKSHADAERDAKIFFAVNSRLADTTGLVNKRLEMIKSKLALSQDLKKELMQLCNKVSLSQEQIANEFCHAQKKQSEYQKFLTEHHLEDSEAAKSEFFQSQMLPLYEEIEKGETNLAIRAQEYAKQHQSDFEYYKQERKAATGALPENIAVADFFLHESGMKYGVEPSRYFTTRDKTHDDLIMKEVQAKAAAEDKALVEGFELQIEAFSVVFADEFQEFKSAYNKFLDATAQHEFGADISHLFVNDIKHLAEKTGDELTEEELKLRFYKDQLTKPDFSERLDVVSQYISIVNPDFDPVLAKEANAYNVLYSDRLEGFKKLYRDDKLALAFAITEQRKQQSPEFENVQTYLQIRENNFSNEKVKDLIAYVSSPFGDEIRNHPSFNKDPAACIVLFTELEKARDAKFFELKMDVAKDSSKVSKTTVDRLKMADTFVGLNGEDFKSFCKQNELQDSMAVKELYFLSKNPIAYAKMKAEEKAFGTVQQFSKAGMENHYAFPYVDKDGNEKHFVVREQLAIGGEFSAPEYPKYWAVINKTKDENGHDDFEEFELAKAADGHLNIMSIGEQICVKTSTESLLNIPISQKNSQVFDILVNLAAQIPSDKLELHENENFADVVKNFEFEKDFTHIAENLLVCEDKEKNETYYHFKTNQSDGTNYVNFTKAADGKLYTTININESQEQVRVDEASFEAGIASDLGVLTLTVASKDGTVRKVSCDGFNFADQIEVLLEGKHPLAIASNFIPNSTALKPNHVEELSKTQQPIMAEPKEYFNDILLCGDLAKPEPAYVFFQHTEDGINTEYFQVIKKDDEFFINLQGIEEGKPVTCKINGSNITKKEDGNESLELDVTFNGEKHKLSYVTFQKINARSYKALDYLINNKDLGGIGSVPAVISPENVPAVYNLKKSIIDHPYEVENNLENMDKVVSTTRKGQELTKTNFAFGGKNISGLSQDIELGMGKKDNSYVDKLGISGTQKLTVYEDNQMLLNVTKGENTVAVFRSEKTADGKEQTVLYVAKDTIDQLNNGKNILPTQTAGDFYKFEIDSLKLSKDLNIEDVQIKGVGKEAAFMFSALGVQAASKLGKSILRNADTNQKVPFDIGVSSSFVQKALSNQNGCTMDTTEPAFSQTLIALSNLHSKQFEGKSDEELAQAVKNGETTLVLSNNPAISICALPLKNEKGEVEFYHFKQQDGKTSLYIQTNTNANRSTVPQYRDINKAMLFADAADKTSNPALGMEFPGQKGENKLTQIAIKLDKFDDFNATSLDALEKMKPLEKESAGAARTIYARNDGTTYYVVKSHGEKISTLRREQGEVLQPSREPEVEQIDNLTPPPITAYAPVEPFPDIVLPKPTDVSRFIPTETINIHNAEVAPQTETVEEVKPVEPPIAEAENTGDDSSNIITENSATTNERETTADATPPPAQEQAASQGGEKKENKKEDKKDVALKDVKKTDLFDVNTQGPNTKLRAAWLTAAGAAVGLSCLLPLPIFNILAMLFASFALATDLEIVNNLKKALNWVYKAGERRKERNEKKKELQRDLQNVKNLNKELKQEKQAYKEIVKDEKQKEKDRIAKENSLDGRLENQEKVMAELKARRDEILNSDMPIADKQKAMNELNSQIIPAQKEYEKLQQEKAVADAAAAMKQANEKAKEAAQNEKEATAQLAERQKLNEAYKEEKLRTMRLPKDMTSTELGEVLKELKAANADVTKATDNRNAKETALKDRLAEEKTAKDEQNLSRDVRDKALHDVEARNRLIKEVDQDLKQIDEFENKGSLGVLTDEERKRLEKLKKKYGKQFSEFSDSYYSYDSDKLNAYLSDLRDSLKDLDAKQKSAEQEFSTKSDAFENAKQNTNTAKQDFSDADKAWREARGKADRIERTFGNEEQIEQKIDDTQKLEEQMAKNIEKLTQEKAAAKEAAETAKQAKEEAERDRQEKESIKSKMGKDFLEDFKLSFDEPTADTSARENAEVNPSIPPRTNQHSMGDNGRERI